MNQEAPDARPVLCLEPTIEKPLDNLAEPLAGLPGREEGGGRVWRRRVQGGPEIAIG